MPWYERERDLMRYYNYLDYQDMAKDPDGYFREKKVINFDIIHHQYWGDPLKKSIKEHKTVDSHDFSKYPKTEEEKVVSLIFRSVNRDDLWVQRDVMIKHFKENFQ